jgi:hypothetical protein
MVGRIRGFGSSESYFSLVYRAILLVSPGLRAIHACVLILVEFCVGVA